MENEEDDFGDLYADVEAEATSAINTAPQSSNSQPVTDEIDKQGEDEDDDGDDFDIVLNSEDDSNKRGNGFSIARSRELEDEEDDNLYKVFFQSQSAAYGSDQGIGCMQAAYWQQLGLRSLGPQSAQSFSLPRARNILDVNIDVFEQKPWKHPGANITDYFNFGFDEDSWKLYCNEVDEYRHRGPVSSGTLLSEPVQSTEVDVGKGQAIEVEGSIFERQSSMDVKRQLDRDSDAIQITILDPEDPSVPETSNHGDVSGDDDVTDHLSFSSDATAETIRTSNDSKESNLVEESVEEENSHENNSKSNKIDSYIDRRKAYTHDRCVTELTQSVKPDYHHSEDSNKLDDKRGRDEKRYHARRLGDNNNNSRKHGDRIYHERSNNPVYKSRTHKEFNLKTLHENDYTISRRLDKRKSFDSYEENILYSKSELSSDYYGKRFCSYEDWNADRFGPNVDQPVFRNSEDDEYYDERRRYIEDNRMMEQDWGHSEKGQKRNKVEIDEFYLDSGYYDDTHGEIFRSYSDNDKPKYDVEYIRWEFRGPQRNKRTHCSFELDNSLLRRDNVQTLASRSSEESHFDHDRRHDNIMPKSSFYRRHGSYECQHLEPFDKEDYMIDIDDPYVVYSQLVNGSDYVKGLTSGQHAATEHRCYKQKNEVFTGNKCGNTYGKSRERLLPPWSRNSHFVSRAVKSSKKHKNNKVVRAEDRKATDEPLDIEEGRILTKEVKVGPGKTRARADGFHNQSGNLGIDGTRILEAMARMEKRRARFNEPNAAITRKDSDSLIKVAVADQVQETGSNKQQRPARKRRWGASGN